VKASPLRHVPDSDGLVLRVGDDQVLPWVEDRAGDVVVVAATGVHLPGLKGENKFDRLHTSIVYRLGNGDKS
jgi:hypothetical protein